MKGRSRRAVVRCIVAAATVLTALSGGGPAAAHTDLVGTIPAQDSVVRGPVSQVRLVFAEPPSRSPLQVAVTAPDGRDVLAGQPRVQGQDVLVPVGPLADAGSYRVSYRVAARDDHPETGGFRFTVAVSRVAGPATPSAEFDAPVAPGALAGADSGVPSAGGGRAWLALVLVTIGLAISAPLGRAAARRGQRKAVESKGASS